MNALPVNDDRYKKTKVRTFRDKVYTDYTNVPEDGVEFNFFTIISIDSLLVYDGKYHLQLYLDKCVYKVVNNQMIDFLDDNLFETDED